MFSLSADFLEFYCFFHNNKYTKKPALCKRAREKSSLLYMFLVDKKLSTSVHCDVLSS